MNIPENNFNKIENKEGPSVSTETISEDKLREIIYQGRSFPQDKHFLDYKEGGVFKYFDLADLVRDINRKDKLFSLVREGDLIVGLGELEKDPFKDKNYWVKFLSVDPRYQEKGYASRLAKEIFQFAKQAGVSLEASVYSEIGHQKLKPLFKKLADESSVVFIDNDRVL